MMPVSRSARTPLLAAVAALLVLDLVGGVVAIRSGVNAASQAWGSEARLAAPWPMMLLQLAAAVAAVGRRRRRAVGAAGLLAAACVVSAVSGFFDGGFAAPELNGRQVALQTLLISWTGVVGLVALAQAVVLGRRAAASTIAAR